MGFCRVRVVGSSPHTRGAHRRPHRPRNRRRIIPAYAGSTRPSSPASAARPDHPRIRGEHASTTTPSTGTSGSSPHTRGAPALRPVYGRRAGIIPAYAGSTGFGVPRHASPRDHPRIRGEHARISAGQGLEVGSSPHTRGALLHHQQRRHRSGIIPAYAGSTGWLRGRACAVEDHPRIRGEHSPVDPPYSKHEGSSPHTRGALHAPS